MKQIKFAAILSLLLLWGGIGGTDWNHRSAPYPPSTTVIDVNWDFTNKITLASGSDLWGITWSGDDLVYTAWGDGGGFGGSGSICKTNTGVASISSTPPTITAANISGCKADGTGCAPGTPRPHDADCDTAYANPLVGSVPTDIISIDNVLWILSHDTTAGPTKLIHSHDAAKTWTTNISWSWSNAAGTFTPTGFVEFGKDYTGARDGYVYIIGQDSANYSKTYLMRVPKANIETWANYEYFSGASGSPAWSATWANATPIHEDAAGGAGGRMIYFPVLGKYILTQTHGEVQKFGVYEATEPWGPWYTVKYYETWGNYGTSEPLHYSIASKWLSADNKTFWMTFSAGGMDSFNLIQGTFTLAADTQSFPTGERLPAKR